MLTVQIFVKRYGYPVKKAINKVPHHQSGTYLFHSRDNYLDMRIYFEELSYQYFEEVGTYGSSDFFCKYGCLTSNLHIWPLTFDLSADVRKQLGLASDLYLWPLTFQHIIDLWPTYLTSDPYIWPLTFQQCWHLTYTFCGGHPGVKVWWHTELQC